MGRFTAGIAAVVAAVLMALLAPTFAGAAVTEVFTGEGSPTDTVESPPIACVEQSGGATDGQR